MRFSTRTRYGLRFLLKLASQPEGTRLQLGTVAKEEQISSGYLEQIVRALRPMGILKGVRGAGGGYQLSKPPSAINLEEIFQHLEGELTPVRCLRTRCKRKDICSTRDFWQDLDAHLREYLRSFTLQDLVKKPDMVLTEYTGTKEK